MDRQFTKLDEIKITGDDLPNDPLVLQTMLEEEGVDLSGKSFQNQLNKRIQVIDDNENLARQGIKDRPEEYLERKRDFLGQRDQIAMRFGYAFVVLGSPIMLIVVFFAEAISSAIGLLTFFNSTWYEVGTSVFLAFALIISLYIIEWRSATLDHRLDVIDNKHPLRNKIGLELKNARIVRRYIFVTIVLLGFLGRLDDKLEDLDGTWLNAIGEILFQSSAQDFLAYILGMSIAAGLLLVSHYAIKIQFEDYVNAVGDEEIESAANFFDPSSFQKQREEVKTLLMRTMLERAWKKKRNETLQKYDELLKQQETELPNNLETQSLDN